MAKSFQSFTSFWEAICKWCKGGNYPTFHPCCNVWTKRIRKGSKVEHKSSVKWRALFSTSEAKQTTQEEYLRAHMHEHGWGTPIRINYPCFAAPGSQKTRQDCKIQKLSEPPPRGFDWHIRPPLISSPRSSPVLHQDAWSGIQGEALRSTGTEKPRRESYAQTQQHIQAHSSGSVEHTTGIIQEKKEALKEEMQNFSTNSEVQCQNSLLAQPQALESQQSLSMLMAQIASGMALMQARLENLERKLDQMAHQSPCTIRIQQIEDSFGCRLSELLREQDQLSSELRQSEENRKELLQLNRSFTSESVQHALEQALKEAEIGRLRQHIKMLNERPFHQVAYPSPQAKQTSTPQSEAQRQRHSASLMDGPKQIGRLALYDDYRIKKVKPF